MTDYNLICGAEIHIEVKTKSKMFCGCKNDPFGADKPNIYTCPVCLGLPGALPVPNKKAIESCIMIGLALNCQVAKVSKFDRKHYFYPDLPKGYQISQYDEPFCFGGYVDTSFGRVGITRVHMEEDTAKLQHAVLDGQKVSLIDFNRSGVPLVEIVSEPDIKSPEQAKEFLKKVRDIVRALGVSDCDMEKGSMRLEANISLKPSGSDLVGLPDYKVEVKNINSFRFFAHAMEYEAKRHAEILDKGETPAQETRGWREAARRTVAQRSKEEAKDYRYFPEPDIPPITISDQWLNDIKKDLPVLPGALEKELLDQGITQKDADILIKNTSMLDFAYSVKKLDEKLFKKVVADVVNKKIDHEKISPEQYVKDAQAKADSLISDVTTLTPIISKIVSDNPQIVEQYKSGKTGVLGFFVGQAMKATAGKADPRTVNKLLIDLLK